MTFKFDGYNWLVRLEKGELLVQSLIDFVRTQNLNGAWLVGIGGALWVDLGFYDLATKKYSQKKIDEPLEILSLQGNLAWENDNPVLHIHGSFSDSKMKAIGGHVRELAVAGTCEILLHRWYYGKLTRSQDADTGLKLLDL